MHDLNASVKTDIDEDIHYQNTNHSQNHFTNQNLTEEEKTQLDNFNEIINSMKQKQTLHTNIKKVTPNQLERIKDISKQYITQNSEQNNESIPMKRCPLPLNKLELQHQYLRKEQLTRNNKISLQLEKSWKDIKSNNSPQIKSKSNRPSKNIKSRFGSIDKAHDNDYDISGTDFRNKKKPNVFKQMENEKETYDQLKQSVTNQQSKFFSYSKYDTQKKLEEAQEDKMSTIQNMNKKIRNYKNIQFKKEKTGKFDINEQKQIFIQEVIELQKENKYLMNVKHKQKTRLDDQKDSLNNHIELLQNMNSKYLSQLKSANKPAKVKLTTDANDEFVQETTEFFDNGCQTHTHDNVHGRSESIQQQGILDNSQSRNTNVFGLRSKSAKTTESIRQKSLDSFNRKYAINVIDKEIPRLKNWVLRQKEKWNLIRARIKIAETMIGVSNDNQDKDNNIQIKTNQDLMNQLESKRLEMTKKIEEIKRKRNVDYDSDKYNNELYNLEEYVSQLLGNS